MINHILGLHAGWKAATFHHASPHAITMLHCFTAPQQPCDWEQTKGFIASRLDTIPTAFDGNVESSQNCNFARGTHIGMHLCRPRHIGLSYVCLQVCAPVTQEASIIWSALYPRSQCIAVKMLEMACREEATPTALGMHFRACEHSHAHCSLLGLCRV